MKQTFLRLARVGGTLLVLGSLSGMAQAAKEQQLSDAADGIGCTYYLIAGRQAWKQELGDWVDRTGTLHGDKPFASAQAGATALAEGLRFDLTALVHAWLGGQRPNHGVLLRALAGDGTVRMASREGLEPGGSAAVVLELGWRDGTRSTLPAMLDVTLDCSTVKGLGTDKTLRVSDRVNTIVQFDLPQRAAKDLARAELRLLPDKLYGHSLTIGAFATEPPWLQGASTSVDGIAARYPRDKGIGKDGDVLFVAGFERSDWLDDWDRLTRSELMQVGAGEGNGFAALDGHALRTTLKKGANTALNLRYLFARHGQAEPEAVYFRYYLRFGADWNPDIEGGKMPGIAGTYGRAGWGSRAVDGTNGWSVRGGFLKSYQTPGGARLTPLSAYAYEMDDKSGWGSIWPWGLGSGGLLENNRWYAVEQYVKLNTPGQADGEYRAWLDGQLVAERTGIRYRSVPDLRIESIWMNVYHGGSTPSPRDMSLYIDNVVVAKRYIGPLREER